MNVDRIPHKHSTRPCRSDTANIHIRDMRSATHTDIVIYRRNIELSTSPREHRVGHTASCSTFADVTWLPLAHERKPETDRQRDTGRSSSVLSDLSTQHHALNTEQRSTVIDPGADASAEPDLRAVAPGLEMRQFTRKKTSLVIWREQRITHRLSKVESNHI